MKEPEDDADIIAHLNERKGLRLVPTEQRASLPPDPKLKALIEEVKGKQRRKRVRPTFDDGPDAA